MTFQLEKYRGARSRSTCPSCGRRNQFARYVNEFGEYVDDSVGRCNRESNCGYHRTPKEFFIENGVNAGATSTNSTGAAYHYRKSEKGTVPSFDTIDNSFIVRSLEHTNRNKLLIFLLSFIDAEHVENAVRSYFVGSTRDGRTCFWLIDKNGRARTGKIIAYDEKTGKRDKRKNPTWIHYELKKHELLPGNFQQKICFFGEHLLAGEKLKPIAVVEAEKTAVVASIFIDSFVWLACGGKSYLKAEKLRMFGRRKIVLYPDADGFDLWSGEAQEAVKLGLNVAVSDFIEKRATAAEREKGFDLADYLLNWEIQAQKENEFIGAYNAKVEAILADENLYDLFNELLDERIAIMESETLEPENIRTLVDYVI